MLCVYSNTVNIISVVCLYVISMVYVHILCVVKFEYDYQDELVKSLHILDVLLCMWYWRNMSSRFFIILKRILKQHEQCFRTWKKYYLKKILSEIIDKTLPNIQKAPDIEHTVFLNECFRITTKSSYCWKSGQSSLKS